MRLLILFMFLVLTFSASGFWYERVGGVCRVPIEYRVGDIDARFGIDAEELKRIALRAETLWEEALGADLFVYDEAAKLPIHFVFDDRQENAVLEAELREDLEAKEGMSEAVSAQYEKSIAEFRSLKKQYESRVVAYEEALKKYNAEVREWNEKGGAPEDVYAELEEREEELQDDYRVLGTLTESLNTLVAELNAMGARGNAIVADYNTIVAEYNTRFNEGEEFTQGDYTGNAIHIYQFDTEDELVIVLAHEFGHALSLGHVDNSTSIMYHFMKDQRVAEGATAEDIAEYVAKCKDASIVTHIRQNLINLITFAS